MPSNTPSIGPLGSVVPATSIAPYLRVQVSELTPPAPSWVLPAGTAYRWEWNEYGQSIDRPVMTVSFGPSQVTRLHALAGGARTIAISAAMRTTIARWIAVFVIAVPSADHVIIANGNRR